MLIELALLLMAVVVSAYCGLLSFCLFLRAYDLLFIS